MHCLTVPLSAFPIMVTSMVLIAPLKKDGLIELERKMTSESLNQWPGALNRRSTKVTMPKFRMKESYDLTEVLARMGMPTAFQPTAADFTGIAELAPDDGRLYVSEVLHKTFVEVNEKGTEAAAATVVSTKTESEARRVTFTPDFRADRPFLFVIRHNKTGAILFMGRMTNPAGVVP